jgi:hypothetical protein
MNHSYKRLPVWYDVINAEGVGSNIGLTCNASIGTLFAPACIILLSLSRKKRDNSVVMVKAGVRHFPFYT